MTYIPYEAHQQLESLKATGQWGDAIALINKYLAKDPTNEEALLQIADINYRRGEIDMAEKAVDFLNSTKGEEDPMALYVKGVLAMEKLQRREAIRHLKRANELTDFTNHEIVRAFGISQYRYGNREKGMYLLDVAYDINTLDAEIIYNIIELSLLERQISKARTMIKYYHTSRDELMVFDKTIAYYDEKINLFDEYLSSDLITHKLKKKKQETHQ
ncbi:MAG: hypothetical protein H6766_00110 [Candidatus Peribacteria bacterium]|nr:MAG: hypothetical protein H6766_00110 [Candidatus Peribacteria bacterium]